MTSTSQNDNQNMTNALNSLYSYQCVEFDDVRTLYGNDNYYTYSVLNGSNFIRDNEYMAMPETDSNFRYDFFDISYDSDSNENSKKLVEEFKKSHTV